MPPGRQLAPLTVTDADRTQLQGMANSTTTPHAVVLHARMILASAEGLTNTDVARGVGVSPQAVGKWRKRYLEASIEGLHDELRPGRPRTYDNKKVARVVNRALHDKPADATRRSTRSIGAAEGVSSSTVSRWFGLLGVKAPKRGTRCGVRDLVDQIQATMRRPSRLSGPPRPNPSSTGRSDYLHVPAIP